MDYRKEALKELMNYHELHQAIRNLEAAMEETVMEMEKLQEKRGTEAQRSRRRLQKRHDLLAKQYIQTQSRVLRCQRALELLDAESRKLLCSWAMGMPPLELMSEMSMEKTTMYRRKKIAMEKFTRALYGSVEGTDEIQ